MNTDERYLYWQTFEQFWRWHGKTDGVTVYTMIVANPMRFNQQEMADALSYAFEHIEGFDFTDFEPSRIH